MARLLRPLDAGRTSIQATARLHGEMSRFLHRQNGAITERLSALWVSRL